VSREALLSKLKDPTPGPRLKTKKVANGPLDKASIEMVKTENHLLALALAHPKLRDMLDPVKTQMVAEPQAAQLLEFLHAHPDFADDAAQATPLRPLADYVKMLSLLFEELYEGLELTELRYEATRLQAHLIEQYVKLQKQRIARELHTADEARIAQLLGAVKKFDNLLKQHQGGA